MQSQFTNATGTEKVQMEEPQKSLKVRRRRKISKQ